MEKKCIYLKKEACLNNEVRTYNSIKGYKVDTPQCKKGCKRYCEDPFVGYYLNGD